MKKASYLAVLAAAGLGLAFALGDRGNAGQWSQGECTLPLDRIPKIAGAWLCVIDFGNGPFEFEMQFSADGNVLMNNTVVKGGNNHLTTALGAWERTGLRTIAVTALIRIVNPDGTLLSYEKVVGEVTINGDTLSGEGAGLIYLPVMDPLDPEVAPLMVLGPSSLSGRRICVHRL